MTHTNDGGPVDPVVPLDPEACSHPGAYVDALAGGHPRTLPGVDDPEPVTFRATPSSGGRRRPGEQFSAALGECSACGSLVASMEIWHPDDARGENVTSYLTPWVALYRGGTPPDRPVPARDTTTGTATGAGADSPAPAPADSPGRAS